MSESRATILTLEQIEDRVRSYPHVTLDGHLANLAESKRPFVWKDMGLKYGVDCLLAPFIAYYAELELTPDIEREVQQAHDQQIAPHFRAIEDALGQLQNYLLDGTGRRVGKKLTDLLASLPDLQADYWQALSPAVRTAVAETLSSNPIYRTGRREPTTDLKVGLYDQLSQCTNLTINNRIEHILSLLGHFDITHDVGTTAVKNLKRLLYVQRQNTLARAERLGTHVDLLRALAKRGDQTP
jgi:hypothetical protein